MARIPKRRMVTPDELKTFGYERAKSDVLDDMGRIDASLTCGVCPMVSCSFISCANNEYIKEINEGSGDLKGFNAFRDMLRSHE